MDFMKVLDQTVREIKREVNLKVLKVPEIEQKVLDATSDEPWGPHGSALSELSQATKKFTECQMIMNVLWTRLTETGANWRHVYKALTVIEYLIANGSERALDDILEHSFRIASLSGFEYVEPNGKDVGINVRKKVETLVGTINDKEKVQAVRNKAAATRDKYFGLSSSGVTYKSSASSYGSYGSSDRYGGFGNSNDSDSFKDSYKDNDRYGKDTKSDYEHRDIKSKDDKIKKGSSQHVGGTSSNSSVEKSVVTADINDDDFDDFDPRGGSSTSGTKNVASNQVDLFGESLIDFMDEPTSAPKEPTHVSNTAAAEVDLFADATFVSASPEPERTSSSHDQVNVDLFANQPAFPAAPVSANVDLFGASDSYLFPPNQSVSEAKTTSTFDPFAISDPPTIQKDTKSPVSDSTNTAAFDPFAAIPMNNFEESDSFGAFASHADLQTTPTKQNVVNTAEQSSKSAVKKGSFQVKSGIWADSLSRGIIDLNISAPKKTNLADIGIVGGLDEAQEEKEKGLPATWYMGKAMGLGMGLSKGGSGNFSTFGNYEFRNNQ